MCISPTAGLGDDHLGNLDPDTGNGLQQLDLMRPRLARRLDHRIEFGQRRLDQIQAVQDRAGQSVEPEDGVSAGDARGDDRR
jgi:hypothetical protein